MALTVTEKLRHTAGGRGIPWSNVEVTVPHGALVIQRQAN